MSGETMVPANGVDLCIETFGEPSDPPLLLIAGGASSMDWWADEFCRRLAAGGRYVIRYDHRDTGRSTSFPAGAPPYTGEDLARDPLELLDALGEPRAHVVGLSMGGGIGQWIAINHPERLLTLTLMSTSAGPDEPAGGAGGDDNAGADAGVSGGDAAGSEAAGSTGGDAAGSEAAGSTGGDAGAGHDAGGGVGQRRQAPFDWADRRAVVERIATEARDAGGLFTADEEPMRRLAERVYDRTTSMASTQTNHWIVPHAPLGRARLREVTVPTLVMHGTADPYFPVAEGEALAREIPGARLVLLEGVGHEHPPAAVWSQVIAEILKHTA